MIRRQRGDDVDQWPSWLGKLRRLSGRLPDKDNKTKCQTRNRKRRRTEQSTASKTTTFLAAVCHDKSLRFIYSKSGVSIAAFKVPCPPICRCASPDPRPGGTSGRPAESATVRVARRGGRRLYASMGYSGQCAKLLNGICLSSVYFFCTASTTRITAAAMTSGTSS